jgi:hypothetical protein
MNQPRHSATDHGAGGPAATEGERFARALAAKDRPALRSLLADPVDFQALTPGRHWRASAPGEVIDDVILGMWFGPGAAIDALDSFTISQLPDCTRVSYLLRVRKADGEYLVEQQAYFSAENGRISRMRILCSGYQKLPVRVPGPVGVLDH